jgi:superfamily II DNA or RNA helicase
VRPDLCPSYWQFVDHYLNAYSSRFGTTVTGFKAWRKQELDELLQDVRIGHTYEQVGRHLPELVENTVQVPLNKELQELYNEAIACWRVEDIPLNGAMAVLIALRRIASNPRKIEALKQLSETFGETPYVVFTWFKDTAADAAKALGVPCITGDTPQEDRFTIAKAGTPVVATIAAMSEGVNLQHANRVVFLEENWTPGSNYQALSRVRRDGGHPTVFVNYIQSKNTVDQHIHRVSKQRSGTIMQVLKPALKG